MERTFFSAGLLCLAVASCGLEHPISRNLDVPCPCPDRAELPDASDVPAPEDRVPPVDTPDAGAADVVDVPIALDAPDVADAPGIDTPDVPELPDVVDAPALPDVVDAPALPDIVDVPMLPDIVDAPALPDIVDVPMRPDIVDVPMLPDVVDAGPPVYESCEEVRMRGLPTGAYLIRAGASTPWLALCDTSDSAGAWTLVLKADGQRATFGYDAPLWTNSDLLAPQSANLDRVEAKFQGFLTLPARALRLQFVTPASATTGTVHGLVLDRLSGAPLQRVFLNGTFVDLADRATENAWIELVPGARLQRNCRRSGLNVRSDTDANARVRIGINGNEDMMMAACRSHDSWIGLGGANTATCAAFVGTTTGNTACNNGPGGAQNLASFAYLWVR
ncbi:MAG: hypothetical protein U0325_20825 [Polyangiales bacterium]